MPPQGAKRYAEAFSKDRDGAGHGPYWYLYYTNQRGKYTSSYVGKSLTPGLADEFGVPRSG